MGRENTGSTPASAGSSQHVAEAVPLLLTPIRSPYAAGAEYMSTSPGPGILEATNEACRGPWARASYRRAQEFSDCSRWVISGCTSSTEKWTPRLPVLSAL